MSNLPQAMKAVILEETGGPEKLQYTDSEALPELRGAQVLVKNSYAGVNFVDTYFRTGLYPSANGYPLTLGQEAVGTIVKVAEPTTSTLQVGERVVWIGQGGYSEYTAVDCAHVVRVPDGLSDVDAIGGFLMGMTALSLVEEAFPVQKGQTVLFHAAAGGVGLLATQILRHKGAIVIATAGGPEKCAIAKENGATHAIDYKTTSGPSWMEQVMRLTKGEGVDVAYDSVGKDTWAGSIEVTKRKGKVVFIGSASGPVPPIDLALTRKKNISVLQSTLMQYIATRAELEHYATGVQQLIKEGHLNVKIHKIYNLQDVGRAHEDLESRRTMGKLLLKL